MPESNIIQNKLKAKTVGVFFGTLSPLHNGHLSEIYQAAMTKDGVLVIVSGYTGDRGDKIGLPLRTRFRYLRECFSDEPSINVSYLNEDELEIKGMNYSSKDNEKLGWDGWVKKLISTVIDQLDDPKNTNVTIYTAEEEYKTELESRIPSNFNVEFIKHKFDDISASKIRENPIKYWNNINRVFRRNFTKKILLIGAPSTGKTVLVRRLSRTFNATFSTEYSRFYQEKYNIRDDEFEELDYARVAQGQYDSNSNEIMSPANNGLFFADTDPIVTKTYSDLWAPDNVKNALKPIYDNLVQNQQWDLIIALLPDVPYINDGFRAAQKDDIVLDEIQKSREEFHNAMLSNFIEYGYGDKVVMLSSEPSENDPHGYYNRYLKAIDLVRGLVQNG